MIRKLGFVLTLLGLALMTWVGVTLLWGEPLTSLYTRHQQQRLSNRLDTLDRQWSAKTTIRPRSRVSPPHGQLRPSGLLRRSALRLS